MLCAWHPNTDWLHMQWPAKDTHQLHHKTRSSNVSHIESQLLLRHFCIVVSAVVFGLAVDQLMESKEIEIQRNVCGRRWAPAQWNGRQGVGARFVPFEVSNLGSRRTKPLPQQMFRNQVISTDWCGAIVFLHRLEIYFLLIVILHRRVIFDFKIQWILKILLFF